MTMNGKDEFVEVCNFFIPVIDLLSKFTALNPAHLSNSVYASLIAVQKETPNKNVKLQVF